MGEIELGDKVKDKISGFEGIAVSRTVFINGCVQYGVVPRVTKGEKYPEEVGIDEDSLIVVKKNTVETKEEDETGGRPTRNIRCRGY